MTLEQEAAFFREGREEFERRAAAARKEPLAKD
jgi:hypothetical protein